MFSKFCYTPSMLCHNYSLIRRRKWSRLMWFGLLNKVRIELFLFVFGHWHVSFVPGLLYAWCFNNRERKHYIKYYYITFSLLLLSIIDIFCGENLWNQLNLSIQTIKKELAWLKTIFFLSTWKHIKFWITRYMGNV